MNWQVDMEKMDNEILDIQYVDHFEVYPDVNILRVCRFLQP